MNISIHFEAKSDLLCRSPLKLTGAARGLFCGGVFLADPEDAILPRYLPHPNKLQRLLNAVDLLKILKSESVIEQQRHNKIRL